MTPRGQGGRGWAPRGGFSGGSPWGRRGDTRDQGGRGRTRRGGRGNNVCRGFQAGQCHFSAGCRFSHDLTNINEQEPSSPVREERTKGVCMNFWTPDQSLTTILSLWNWLSAAICLDDRDPEQDGVRSLDCRSSCRLAPHLTARQLLALLEYQQDKN
jgi:hypothetical protein